MNSNSPATSLELELKQLIIEALKLEDVTAEQIDSQEPLFGDGLGLDSIDALELGVILRKRYGITIAAVTPEVKAHFANIQSLAAFIALHRKATS
ncbi:MAG: phosphopantetheine-binding protein [Pseudomonadota bacterium]|nr:phosphopantetheine-binding protein [Pseudomonadota bacterium]